MLKRMNGADFATLVAQVDIQNDQELLPYDMISMLDLGDFAQEHRWLGISSASVFLADKISELAKVPTVVPDMTGVVMAEAVSA